MEPGESVAAYVAELRAIDQHCNYGNSLSLMPRDRLLCRLNNEYIQRRLLSEDPLTFEKAFKLAKGIETAAKNIQSLKGEHGGGAADTEGTLSVHKLYKPKRLLQVQIGDNSCYRCGQFGHLAEKCKFKSAKCHECGKI